MPMSMNGDRSSREPVRDQLLPELEITSIIFGHRFDQGVMKAVWQEFAREVNVEVVRLDRGGFDLHREPYSL